MFSTILDKVTGFFDRRTLISAFFPSLIFWGITLLTLLALQTNWQIALKAWSATDGIIQFFLIVAFFTWVTFWSFLTLNVRTAFIRLLEGYWPTTPPFGFFHRQRIHFWQKRWEPLQKRYEGQIQQMTLLQHEQQQYKQLQSSSHATSGTFVGQWLANTQQILQRTFSATMFSTDLDGFLQHHASLATAHTVQALSLDDLQVCGQATRDWWQKCDPWLTEATQNPHSPWSQRLKDLEAMMIQLSQDVDQRLNKIRSQPLGLYHELFFYYPSNPEQMMATRLGNVLKAAELYAWERYGIDSVLLWPLLQSRLPDAFSSQLQDAKASFDLMATLFGFLVLFGVPLSLWGSYRSSGSFPWWVPFITGLIALAQRRILPIGLALLAVILSFLVQRAPVILHIQVLATLLAILFLLLWLCYQNAIQAVLGYGESIRAAFDLSRWEVLDGLHLPLPTDIVHEREVWKYVNQLLAYNIITTPLAYRTTAQEAKKDASPSPKKTL